MRIPFKWLGHRLDHRWSPIHQAFNWRFQSCRIVTRAVHLEEAGGQATAIQSLHLEISRLRIAIRKSDQESLLAGMCHSVYRRVRSIGQGIIWIQAVWTPCAALQPGPLRSTELPLILDSLRIWNPYYELLTKRWYSARVYRLPQRHYSSARAFGRTLNQPSHGRSSFATIRMHFCLASFLLTNISPDYHLYPLDSIRLQAF